MIPSFSPFNISDTTNTTNTAGPFVPVLPNNSVAMSPSSGNSLLSPPLGWRQIYLHWFSQDKYFVQSISLAGGLECYLTFKVLSTLKFLGGQFEKLIKVCINKTKNFIFVAFLMYLFVEVRLKMALYCIISLLVLYSMYTTTNGLPAHPQMPLG